MILKPVRKSVPTAGMSAWWLEGWAYMMPDFDKKDHSIIEWTSEKAPVEPNNRVQGTLTESANERSASRA